MKTNQKILIKKALAKHPGKALFYVSDKTSWEECFSIFENKLYFYYNLESGATHNESLIISKD